jgi:hypothetical protein
MKWIELAWETLSSHVLWTQEEAQKLTDHQFFRIRPTESFSFDFITSNLQA